MNLNGVIPTILNFFKCDWNFFSIKFLLLLNCIVYGLFQKGFNDFAIFASTNRGNRKLIHDQFYYTKSSDVNGTGIQIWRCAASHNFPQLKCKARALTMIIEGYELVKIDGSHTHSANYKEKKRT